MNKSSVPIRILIVDDHPVVQAGLTSMLNTHDGIEVVGSASGGREALKLLEQNEADILLLDLRMPGMSGIEILQAMKTMKSNVRAIVLTSFETDENIYRAVQAGAHGFLLKDTSQQQMLEAIISVHAGKRFIPRDRCPARGSNAPVQSHCPRTRDPHNVGKGPNQQADRMCPHHQRKHRPQSPQVRYE